MIKYQQHKNDYTRKLIQLLTQLPGKLGKEVTRYQDSIVAFIKIRFSLQCSQKKVSEIYSQLQTGSQYGMNTLEQCLNNLYAEGLITQEEALGKASNPKAIKF